MDNFSINKFSEKTFTLLKKGIEVNNKRYQVIANNIANADTPGFKRSNVNFEAQLKRAFEMENDQSLQANVTNEKHIPFKIPINWKDINPKIVLDYATSMRNDGNNVDIDRETTELSKTTMVYSAILD
ncbi:MAG TPA: flagellar basal body rod protein FlgB, partial [Exilispira sp.]|nr:flagellar basal body rod protein FlgB [Exilispira sp.]